MVLEVFSDSRQIHCCRYVGGAQQVSGSDSTQLEDLRAVNAPGCENNILFRADHG